MGKAKATEDKDEHKIEALEKYIKKYTKEGHEKGDIRSWLIKYGYDDHLVDAAFEQVEHAKA